MHTHTRVVVCLELTLRHARAEQRTDRSQKFKFCCDSVQWRRKLQVRQVNCLLLLSIVFDRFWHSFDRSSYPLDIYLSTSFPKSVLDFHGILQLSTNFPSCRNSGQTLTKLWLNVNFQVMVLPSFTCNCSEDVINSLPNWKIRTFILWHNYDMLFMYFLHSGIQVNRKIYFSASFIHDFVWR